MGNRRCVRVELLNNAPRGSSIAVYWRALDISGAAVARADHATGALGGPAGPWLAAGRCNSKKMLGITKSTSGSCTTKPEMIATARGCCIDKPWLIASANGSSVRMAASVVITIGRIRFCPASINAI